MSNDASSGCATPFAYALSFAGIDAFQRSFCAKGTSTSLKRGFPSRETCT